MENMIILGHVKAAGIFAAGLTRESAVVAEVILGTNEFWKCEDVAMLRNSVPNFIWLIGSR